MIKRTLYFGNPAYLNKKNEQLIIKTPEDNSEESSPTEEYVKEDINKKYKERTNQNSVPIEDIGIVVLDNQQITITQGLLASLLENNAAVVTCGYNHMPNGLFMPLSGNQLQSERFQAQIESTEPLKKQLWQQTISAKIRNQAAILSKRRINIDNMLLWAKKVRSGDPDNYEGRAAAYYWKNIFPMIEDFKRDYEGEPPNNLLNYCYAILRAITARGLVASGLLPTLGIHHSNKYNAYCLADDIMEPYRPYADKVVLEIIKNGEDFYELNTSLKKQLLAIGTADVYIDNEKSPLMIGMQRTTASLAKCFAGEARKIIYPDMFTSNP
jgi:CRISP-associated protein Cas1